MAVFACSNAAAQARKSSTKKIPAPAVVPKDDNKPVRDIPFPVRIPRYTPTQFYIAGVIDATGTNDTIGTAIKTKGFKQKLVLKGGTKHFFTTLLDSMLQKDTTLYPVILKIKQLSINEVRERFYDNSEARYEYEFLSVYKNDTLRLLGYSGGGEFSTYMHLKKVYDTAITTMAEGWKRLESNMAELAENHPAFAKKVTIAVNIRTNPGSADTLFYTGNNLVFDDFTGTAYMQNGGFGHMYIDYEPNISYGKGTIHVKVDLAATFLRKRSWLSGEGRSPEVLKHLNYRFRLVHLYTLLLRERLEKAALTPENYQSIIGALYDTIRGEALRKIEAYDDETQYGKDIREQMRWEQNINKGLPLD
jgi:hypothetical protein